MLRSRVRRSAFGLVLVGGLVLAIPFTLAASGGAPAASGHVSGAPGPMQGTTLDTTASRVQRPLDSHLIPQFEQELPLLDAAGGSIQTVDGTQPATVHMCEFQSRILPPGTLGSGAVTTTVWGYVAGNSCPSGVRDTFTGPIVLAKRGTPTSLSFENDLGTTETTKLLAYKNSVDQSLFWADPANGEMNACDSRQVPAPGTACAQHYSGPIPATVHLHGGEVPPEDDGGPDSWFTSDGKAIGPEFYSQSGVGPSNVQALTYPNTQEAAPLWFHDHTMGATRLNVYAGLAGAYLLADDGMKLPRGLAEYGLDNHGTPELTVPLVIQDRMFDTTGQLYFPAGVAGDTVYSPNPDHPYWVPEFIGDTILVNGKAWPYTNVEPKRYRFLFLNGSNARSYAMSLVDPVSGNKGPALWVIGTDGGYLDRAAKIDEHSTIPNQFFIMPGERYEVVVDFSGYGAGVRGPNGKAYSGTWLLQNTSPAPYPSGDPVDPATTGKVMEFKVGACSSGQCGAKDGSFDPKGGRQIRSDGQKIVRLVDPKDGKLAAGVKPVRVRAMTLNELEKDPGVAIDPASGIPTSYPGGPLEVIVNNSTYDGGSDMAKSNCKRADFTAVTLNGMTMCLSETPTEGDTEVWEIANLTMDAHPIHLHLVQFQLMNRQDVNVDAYEAAYAKAFPGGDFQPEYGPPLAITPSKASGGTWGGNPDFRPYLSGRARPATPAEAGWKDTVMVPPGQVTRFVVRFAPTDVPLNAAASKLAFPFDPTGGGNRGYVWHCHIIDHEDNEMMRPYEVKLNPAAPAPADRALVRGRDY